MRPARRRRRTLVLVLTGGCLLFACSGPLSLDDTPLGLAEGVDRAAPTFVVEASPVTEEGALLLEVRAALAPADLVFESTETGYRAHIGLTFRARDVLGRETFAAHEVADTLAVSSYEETQSVRPRTYSERLHVPAGRVMAEVVLTDRRGEPLATRRFETSVPDAADGPAPLPARILRDGVFVVGPATAQWQLADSVRVAAGSFPEGSTPEPVVTLARGRADLDVPTPPFWISPPRGSLVHRGADFVREADTILVARGATDLLLPLLDEGVYSVSVALGERDEPQSRPLIVLPPGHPRVETIDGLIDALAYVAYPNEMEEMRAGMTADERRARFDAFWASLFDVRAIAEQTMRLYYGRIEEANRLFTSHKPGWRTDRGMVYVVLGPPEFVERTPDGETWRYPRGVAGDTYFFERVRYDDAPWVMEHHVLRRSARHEDDWHRAIRRWRRGEMR